MNVLFYNTLDLIDAMFISDRTQGTDVANNFSRCPRGPASRLTGFLPANAELLPKA